MYLLLLAIVGAASAVLASAAWPHRRHAGLVHFAVMEWAMAWWLLCYLGEQLDRPRAELWFAAKFPAIGLITPSWLLFVLHHVGKPPRSRWWRLLYIWPVLLAPLLFTNDLHRWFFSEVVMRRELVGLNGPLFPLHLTINYSWTVIAIVLLVGDWARTRRRLSAVLAAGAMLPWGANILNELAKASPAVSAWLPLNPTLPGFGFSALAIGYAVMRDGLLDPKPIARDLLFESFPELVLVLNHAGTIVDANQAAAERLGGGRALTGRAWADVFGNADDWQTVPTSDATRLEKPWRSGDATLWFDLERRALIDHRRRSVGSLVVLRDITARKRLEEELRRESHSDPLTGLPNRRYFDEECARLRVSRDFPVTVFAFDLDDLKVVNDTMGHQAGDQLLLSMSAFLRHFFRTGDRIFRIGGDEFSILLPRTHGGEAEGIAARLAISLETFNATRSVPLRFSLGWAVIDRAEEWDEGMPRADEALYVDKRRRAAARARNTPAT